MDYEKADKIRSRGEPYTLGEMATILGVSRGWVQRRTRDRETMSGGRPAKFTEQDLDGLRPALIEHLGRRVGLGERPYVPAAIREYHRYHSTLNEFTWLVKAYYADRDALKRRQFRLDILFQRFIETNSLHPDRIRRNLGCVLAAQQQRLAISALHRVWYNEMAYCHPIVAQPFLLERAGVQANIDSSATRYLFPSWRISCAYYCVYHAIRSLCDSLDIPYRRQEHNSPFRAFKAMKLSPAQSHLLCYPFNLAYAQVPRREVQGFLPEQRPWLNFRYGAHPRPPGRDYRQTLTRVVGDFRKRWKAWPTGMQRQPFMLPDLLLQFRNWVNYVDIDNVVALKSPGFRAYLDQDLGLLVWFHAAFAEMAAIAQLGPRTFKQAAEKFWRGFVAGDAALWASQAPWPMDARIRIYVHQGLLPSATWNPDYPPRARGAVLELT